MQNIKDKFEHLQSIKSHKDVNCCLYVTYKDFPGQFIHRNVDLIASLEWLTYTLMIIMYYEKYKVV